jgi:hypothetical protein
LKSENGPVLAERFATSHGGASPSILRGTLRTAKPRISSIH